MTINERFKHIRKTLKLNQTDFGKPLRLGQGGVGNIERGTNAVIDRTILLLCQAYNVNEEWLRNGGNDDEMFCEISESGILEFAKEQGLGKMSQSILLAYLKMDDKKRDAFDKLLEELIINVQIEFPPEVGEVTQEEPKGYHWEDFTEEEAREEAERYYRELLEEKRAMEKLSAFEEQKHA